MEVLCEALCKYIEPRAKNISVSERMLLKTYDDCMPDDVFQELNAIQQKLRRKESKLRKLYECVPCKGLLVFLLLIVIAIFSFLALSNGLWWVCLIGLGVVVCFVFLYLNNTKRSEGHGDWKYLLELKLRLMFWNIPPPDDEMTNPRCIFMSWNRHEASTFGEWMTTHVLPKLQLELGIKNIEGLNSLITNAVNSSNDFQEYSLWKDSVKGRLGNVPLWCFFLLAVVCVLLFIAVAAYYESAIAHVISFSAVVGLGRFLYRIMKSTEGNVELDVEANQQLFDVICRVHRLIKKETLFFAVVMDRNDDLEISNEWNKYFKFLIYVTPSDLSSPGLSRHLYDHKYILYPSNSRIGQIMRSDARDEARKIAIQCLRYNELEPVSANPSVLSKNAVDFLYKLIEVNDNHNNVLSCFRLFIAAFIDIQIPKLPRQTDTLRLIFRIYGDKWIVNVPSHIIPKMSIIMPELERLAADASYYVNKIEDGFLVFAY